MRIIFTLVLFFVILTRTYAQEFFNDTKNVNYHSRFEEIVMEAPLKETEESKIRLFMASVPESNFAAVNEVQQKLENVYRDLEAMNLRPNNLSKTINKIDGYLRKQYFKRYDPFAGFPEIFSKGQYNAATGTALYVLILDHLGLSYQLIQESSGVYPQVGKEKLPVKHLNDPKNKAPGPEQQAKDFATLLKMLNLITEEEAARKEPGMLYKEYFRAGPEYINISKLGGILYYQRALKNYFARDYQLAAENIDKAQLLYPSMRNQAIKFAALYQQAAEKPIEESAPLLALYEKHPASSVRQEILRRFVKLTEIYLYEKGQPNELKKHFEVFQEKITRDEALKEEIREIYYLQLAEYHNQSSKQTKLFGNLDSLFRLYPNNPDIQHQLGNLLILSLSKERDFKIGMEKLKDFRMRYPFIIVNPYYKDFELFYCAERIRHTFDQDDSGLGQKYLEDFETLLRQNGQTPRFQSWITTAFLSASFYYFKNNDYPNARRMVERALIHLPENEYFKHRLELLRKY